MISNKNFFYDEQSFMKIEQKKNPDHFWSGEKPCGFFSNEQPSFLRQRKFHCWRPQTLSSIPTQLYRYPRQGQIFSSSPWSSCSGPELWTLESSALQSQIEEKASLEQQWSSFDYLHIWSSNSCLFSNLSQNSIMFMNIFRNF